MPTGPPGFVGTPIAGDVTAPTPGAEGTGYAPVAPDESSPTNDQEAGVDEPDIVKTAGSVIFTVDGTTLRAVDTSGNTPTLVGTLELPDGAGDAPALRLDYQLLLAGDRLLAIGSSYGYAIPFETGPGGGSPGVASPDIAPPDIAYPAEPRVWIAEVDISDPAAMSVLQTEKLDGSFISARLTGSTARLVTTSYPTGPIPDVGKGRQALPRTTVRDRETHSVRRGHLGGCATVSHPSRFSGVGMLVGLHRRPRPRAAGGRRRHRAHRRQHRLRVADLAVRQHGALAGSERALRAVARAW